MRNIITDNKHIYFCQINLNDEILLIDEYESLDMVAIYHIVRCKYIQNKGKISNIEAFKYCNAFDVKTQNLVLSILTNSIYIESWNNQIEQILLKSDIARRNVKMKKLKINTDEQTNDTTPVHTNDVTNDNDNVNDNVNVKDNKITNKNKVIGILTNHDLSSINKEALNEWLEYKKYQYEKAGITKLINLLSKYNLDTQQAMVDSSIMNNYKGLFEVKKNTQSRQLDANTRKKIYQEVWNGYGYDKEEILAEPGKVFIREWCPEANCSQWVEVDE